MVSFRTCRVHALGVVLYPGLTVTVFREGPHAKYHYMICGVQGASRQSTTLQNRPPRPLLQVTSHEASSMTRLGPCGLVNSRFDVKRMINLRPPSLTFNLIPVRWRVQHLHTVQAWYPYLHGYRYWRCALDLHPIPLLVCLFSHHGMDTNWLRLLLDRVRVPVRLHIPI